MLSLAKETHFAKMTRRQTVAALATILALVVAGNGAYGWDFAHATFYGDMSGGETMSK